MKKRKIQREKTNIILGKDSEFEGDLKFYGTLLIDGRFKGNITGEGTISIGEEGFVESDIHVSNMIIYGEVHGSIMVEEKIEIIAPGKVFGTIEAPIIEIEKGVVFKGKCHTQRPIVVVKEELEKISV